MVCTVWLSCTSTKDSLKEASLQETDFELTCID